MDGFMSQKEKRKLFNISDKVGAIFAFLLMFSLSGWSQQPVTLELNGVYLINDKQADPGTTNCRHLYPNGNYLRVDANLGKNRYWVVDYTETIDGVEYYRFKNRDTNKYICVRDAENQPLETGAIGTANYDSNRPNAFLFRLVRRSDEPYYVNVLPYDYNNPDTGYGWYNKNNNTGTNIGLRIMNNGNNLNQWDWKVLWNFEKVEERGVLTDPIIGGPALITEAGTYDYGGLTPSYKVYVGSTQFSSTTSGMSYVWTAEGLPAGTTFVSQGQKQLIVSSMPAEPTVVTITCTASKTVNGVVYTSTCTHTVMIGTPTHITSLDQLGSSGYYILDNDIDDASGYSTIENFTGYFDGNFHSINGLAKPLFGTMNSATVRNVVLDNIAVNDTGDVGAIAKVADGNSRIYNCGILATNSSETSVSSTVSGTENVGGLIGKIDGYTHVVNCYSYANVTGGSVKAGLVGYNSFSSNQDEIRTMVVNCMFYGDIDTGGGTVSPIFGGERIYNGIHTSGAIGINTYDYFREGVSFDESFENLDQYYNCWPAEERHLTRFEYYRSILNSNRRLCVWWIIGQQYQYQLESDPEMVAKWVLDPSIAPYPILKPWGKYHSVINDDQEYVWSEEDKEWKSRESMPAYQGKKLGMLTVTVKAGSNNSGASDKTLYLPILDMDTLHHDYCYAKVQLPYYNEQFGNPNATTHAEKYANNYTDKIVTGWKITDVTGGTKGTFVEDWESGYNFADRYCTDKDLYSVSKRVFAQGGYYYVPEGVTAITIEAYWGKAVYLHNYNHYLDKVNASYDGFIPAGTVPSKFPDATGYTVYATIQSAIAALQLEGSGENALTVYDQAVVLVGNYQYLNGSTQNTFGYSTTGNVDFATKNKPFTVTSVDLDFDNEPDYCMELQYGSGTTRANVHPIRFDFISVPNLGLAIRTNTFPLSCGLFMLRGHFEITETAFMHTTQFEYDSRSDYQKEEAPVIFNGGEFEQLCSSEKGDITYNTRTDKTKYFIIGGHAWLKEFTPGTHGNRTIRTRHCAVNVLGGEYNKFYLSGIFRSINNRPDNPHCYTNGGKFGVMAGAGMESVDGDVTFKIDHSIIGEFYGGGINSSQPVTGSIAVTVNNSIVGKYCGGPKMGDMLPSTEVVTEANNTIFGQFYGGGNGGTNFNRNRRWDNTIDGGNQQNLTPDDWNTNGQFSSFVPFTYVGPTEGYHAQFEFEHIQYASGSDDRQVARTYRHEAQFSATNVIKATSTLTNCTVLQDFYGGGNLGAVLGDATSKLVNTTIWGSAYGGGYSATIPRFCVHDKSTVVYPYRDYAGYYHPGSLDYERDGDEVRYYTWIHELPEGVTGIDENHPNFQHDGKWYCYTEFALTDLGRVEGDTKLTIDGASKIYGQERPEDGLQGDLSYAGAAFGGGNEAKVYGNSTVNVGTEPEEQPMDSVQQMFVGNVYGGGKIATTGLNSTVNMYHGRIGVVDENGIPRPGSGNVYGGGKGSFEDENAGHVGGNSNVLIKGGQVLTCVYGGSEYGNVGLTTLSDDGVIIPDENTGTSTVTISGGTIGFQRPVDSIIAKDYGHVFGGGKGNLDYTFNMRTNVNRSLVNINGGRIYGSVFGGGEEGHVLGDVQLNVTDGMIGTYGYTGKDGNVFGGGRGSETIALTAGSVGGNIEVNVSGGTMLGSVYGGGQSGSVGFYFARVGDEEHYGVMQEGSDHGYITVNVNGGEIGHEAIGGDIPENIGGNVYGGCKGIVEEPSETSIQERMATAKQATVNILGSAFIRGSVFGGAENGHIRDNTYVNVSGGQVGGTARGNVELDGNMLHGNVYAGGRGIDQWEDGNHGLHYCPTAGIVGGNSFLSVTNGRICRNAYGGGSIASVGDAEEQPQEDGSYLTGKATVTISGGEIGVESDDNGHVFGSSRGRAGAAYRELAFVKNTDVTVKDDAMIHGSVFGGGENGHVRQNTLVNIENGNIGDNEDVCQNEYHGNVYGGGRGIDKVDDTDDYSWTAGRVNWNATVNISGGKIFRNVYGGGNLACVGLLQLTEEGDPYVDDNLNLNLMDENNNLMYLVNEDGSPQLDGDGNRIPNPDFDESKLTGWARINITGGRIGTDLDEDNFHGNVFGSGHGRAGFQFKDMAYVHNTDVRVSEEDGNTMIKGSVFAGGEDGHVTMHTKVTVNGGQIGEKEGNQYKGNVYGGGRGIDLDANGNLSETAGLVKGHTRVYINDGIVLNSVYGGGNASVVGEEKVVNINGGDVRQHVFGGSKAVPDGRSNFGLKTVNVRGGHVYGNVYGCSSNSNDGDEEKPLDWTAFVNINGGLIDGNVHGAGQIGEVKGSVSVCIGKESILNAPNHTFNVNYNDCGGDEPGLASGATVIEPTASKLLIGGSVYGGSDYYGGSSSLAWKSFTVSGYSNIYIDGKDYDTQNTATTTEMNIGGGLFGSSTHCESGEAGRHIVLKDYGHRNDEGENAELEQATRTLTTIQRCGNLLVDHSNVNLSGANDISNSMNVRQYAVMKVDTTLIMANASAFVLGNNTQPAYMDSIRRVRSLHSKDVDISVYSQQFIGKLDNNWEWIGVNPNGANTLENARLYYTSTASTTPLKYNQENAIIFKGDSRLWVRYHRKEKVSGNWNYMGQHYGELEGFFRMKSHFEPYGTESFAYARPKITLNNNYTVEHPGDPGVNKGDGGFLSYEIRKNFFTEAGDIGGWIYPVEGDDGGEEFTKTKQYPYFNIYEIANRDGGVDMVEYRQWVITKFEGKTWYVDGRGIGEGKGGWGQDKYHRDGWGHYPDKPKLTVSAAVGNDELHRGGICWDEAAGNGFANFDKAKDIIFVVGPVSSLLEREDFNRWPNEYTLKLFRYPGGHQLSNGLYDTTISTSPAEAPSNSSYNGLATASTAGPGANVKSLLEVEESQSITLDNVLFDGLYGYDAQSAVYYTIPTTFSEEQTRVTEPLVVTYPNSTLSMKGEYAELETGVAKFGTVLKRGYNNTNGDVWFTNADYDDDGSTVHHGGALYVNASAVVNVERLVTIENNKQYLKIDDGAEEIIESNVYLPTFSKHVNIVGNFDHGTNIGITSPIRNTSWHFVHNTFSPVAVVTAEGDAAGIARAAWSYNDFYDDLNWFFSNESTNEIPHYTYYSPTIVDYDYPYTNSDAVVDHFDPTKTLFFGWTWNNVVRKAPGGFGYEQIDSAEDLAWLISLVNGTNKQVADNMSNQSIKQTDDLNLQPYVWVPIGAQKSGSMPFSGTFDGQGHLIDNLAIAYIGEGDRIYQRTNYGLFGQANNAIVDRTFVTSGYICPVGAANIGGLVGNMNGTSSVLSNSEASVDIYCPDKDNSDNAAGGLVGLMRGGEIHSSMAMPIIHATTYKTVGGLVGQTNNDQNQIALNNSFSNVRFVIGHENEGGSYDYGSVILGGLVGTNYGSNIQNCYVHLQNNCLGMTETNFALLAGLNNGGSISKSYAQDGNSYQLTKGAGGSSNCYKYTPVITADELGYLYSDNILTIGEDKTPMFIKLNEWVTDDVYSKWARPTIPEINGDLPVLHLYNNGEVGNGDFRSLATYKGGHPQLGAFPIGDDDNQGVVLQYGGTVRDGENNELDAMLNRMKNYNNNEDHVKDYLYIYGDVTVDIRETNMPEKISICEHASILFPGTLAGFDKTYVGVTFDNSYCEAYSTPGINHIDEQLLPRDWHMFSSPISNASLGFDYVVDGVNTNEAEYSGGDHGSYYNNPWPYLHNQEPNNTEFTWLNNGSAGDNRYWMKSFNEAIQSTDGYFPTQRGALFSDPTNPDLPLESEIENLFIEATDEYPGAGRFRYPYGMDMFCWYEPEPHWINFKRNGPNHWHSDEYDEENHLHAHLPYTENGISNRNEDWLVPGKGYMAAIALQSYLQSHGNLNATSDADNPIQRTVTTDGNACTGWNMVGNPFHAYLDFGKFGTEANNAEMLATKEGNPFYVVYDADKYEEGGAFRYYVATASSGGAYAGPYLHPHQGFFIKATKGGQLNFSEEMNVSRNDIANLGDAYFRNAQPAYPLVNLYLSSGNGCTDVTVVEFHRPEWGGAAKLRELITGNGRFYAYHDGKHYAALFNKEGSERVPLWFEAMEDDVFTISWNTANGDFSSLYLVDNITGVRYDMLNNDKYVFEGRKSDYYSRFYITFNVLDVDENMEDSKDTNMAFFDGLQWVITGEGRLELIDLQGRILWTSQISGGQSRVCLPDVSKGLYFFRLTNTNETRVQKIIIK